MRDDCCRFLFPERRAEGEPEGGDLVSRWQFPTSDRRLRLVSDPDGGRLHLICTV